MPQPGIYGWSVGRFDWLNDPASKVNRYWRVVEEGSNATRWPWQGQRVIGLWGGKARPRGGLISGDLSPFMPGRGNQKFVPFFKDIETSDARKAARGALAFFFEGGRGRNMDLLRVTQPPSKGTRRAGNGRPWDVVKARKRFYFYLMNVARVEDMPFVQGVIIREVQAGHYYARARVTFNPMQAEITAMRETFSHILGLGNTPQVSADSAAGLARMRKIQAFDDGDIKVKKGQRTSEGVNRNAGYAVNVTASVIVQDNIRNALGRFSKLQFEVARTNATVARAFQAEVVALMARENRRPVSGDLRRATADARNRTPS